jgi:hypothetical protein
MILRFCSLKNFLEFSSLLYFHFTHNDRKNFNIFSTRIANSSKKSILQRIYFILGSGRIPLNEDPILIKDYL